MKIFLKIFAASFIIAIAVAIYFFSQLPYYDPDVKVIEIYSRTYDEKIYIKKEVRGITGGYSIIVISNSPDHNFEKNKNTDYIYEGLTPFFYKFENGTLNVFVRSES